MGGGSQALEGCLAREDRVGREPAVPEPLDEGCREVLLVVDHENANRVGHGVLPEIQPALHRPELLLGV